MHICGIDGILSCMIGLHLLIPLDLPTWTIWVTKGWGRVSLRRQGCSFDGLFLPIGSRVTCSIFHWCQPCYCMLISLDHCCNSTRVTLSQCITTSYRISMVFFFFNDHSHSLFLPKRSSLWVNPLFFFGSSNLSLHAKFGAKCYHIYVNGVH